MTATISKHVNPVPGPAKSDAKFFYDFFRAENRPVLWHDMKDLSSRDQQSLPSRVIDGTVADLQFGGSSGFGADDGLRILEQPYQVMYFPAVPDNSLSLGNTGFVSPWTNKVIGKLRYEPLAIGGRPLSIAGQALLEWPTASSIRVIGRGAGGTYPVALEIPVPFNQLRLHDIGLEINGTTTSLYCRLDPNLNARIEDETWDSWTGWSVLGSAAFTPAMATAFTSSWLGSNGPSNLHMNALIHGCQISVDGVVRTYNPKLGLDSGGSTSVGRSETGLPMSLVKQATWITDGVDDKGVVSNVFPAQLNSDFTFIQVSTIMSRTAVASFPNLLDSLHASSPSGVFCYARTDATTFGIRTSIRDAVGGVVTAAPSPPGSGQVVGDEFVAIHRYDHAAKILTSGYYTAASGLTFSGPVTTAALVYPIDVNPVTQLMKTYPGSNRIPLMYATRYVSNEELLKLCPLLLSGDYE